MKNAEQEMACKDQYRHLIVNDGLNEAIAELIAVMGRYREGGEPYENRNSFRRPSGA